MVRGSLKCLAGALALFSASEAVPAASFMNTGNDFIAECPPDGEVYRVCMAYILGVGGVMLVADPSGRKHWCPPANNSNGQLYAIVSKALKDHPEKWNEPLYVLVASALIKAFPCK